MPPQWTQEPDAAEEFVKHVREYMRSKFNKDIPRRARTHLRGLIELEIALCQGHTAFETGTNSSEEAARCFAELARGKLNLVNTSADYRVDVMKVREGEERGVFGVTAVNHVVRIAREYHRQTQVCPVAPF